MISELSRGTKKWAVLDLAEEAAWSRGGNQTGSIRYRVEQTGVRLLYRTRLCRQPPLAFDAGA